MLDIYIFKILFALVIFVTALIGGLLPFIWRNNNRNKRKFVFCGEYFSRGIFFGAGLIHMLPDAQAKFSLAQPNQHYPIVMATCAFTIYVLQFIEQGLTKIFNLQIASIGPTLILTILISVHSIILGATLGVEDTFAGIFIVFIAIIAHKMAESFALGINLKYSGILYKYAKQILFLFSCMTPIGIFFGSVLESFFTIKNGQVLESLFQAVSAGTFLYIATFNHLHITDHKGTISKLMKINSLGFGILIMALIAIWL